MSKQIGQFNLLLEKYIANDISESDISKLKKLLVNNKKFQKEFAEALTFESAIQNVMLEKSAAQSEVEENGKILPFKNKLKHRSTRFKNQKEDSKDHKLFYLLVAIITLSTTIWFMSGYLKKKEVPDNNAVTKTDNATVTNADYSVVVRSIGKNNSVKVRDFSKYHNGDLLETKENEYIKITTKEGSTIQINENSTVVIAHNRLNVIQGEIYADIAKQEKDYFKNYGTNNKNSFLIKGTIFEISNMAKTNSSILSVEEGLVQFNRLKMTKPTAANYSLSANDTTGFGKKRKLFKDEIVAPWKFYLQYLNNKNVLFIDNFDSNKIRNYWKVSKTGEGFLEKLKHQSISVLMIQGKSEISIKSRMLQVNKKNIAVKFASTHALGKGQFEYGFIIYFDGKIVTQQAFSVLGKKKNIYRFKDVSFIQGESVAGKTKLQKVLPKFISTFGLNTTNKTSNETSNEKEIFYEDNKDLPSFQSFAGKTENIEVEFYIKGISDDAQAAFGIDSFVATRNKILSEKISKQFLPYLLLINP